MGYKNNILYGGSQIENQKVSLPEAQKFVNDQWSDVWDITDLSLAPGTKTVKQYAEESVRIIKNKAQKKKKRKK